MEAIRGGEPGRGGISGFQLWLALPPSLELSEPESPYVDAAAVPQVGPARVILGRHDSATIPIPPIADLSNLQIIKCATQNRGRGRHGIRAGLGDAAPASTRTRPLFGAYDCERTRRRRIGGSLGAGAIEGRWAFLRCLAVESHRAHVAPTYCQFPRLGVHCSGEPCHTWEARWSLPLNGRH